MTLRVPNEGEVGESIRRRLAPIAAQHGVSIERLVEVVRARRRFRRAQFYRKRARRRALAKNPSARKFRFQKEPLLAGHGELHGLLGAAGMSKEEFCEFAGIDRSVFHRWYGHCLHKWPTVLLRNFVWARNMARQMQEWGRDPEAYRPQLPPPAKAGAYPRTTQQVKQLLPEAAKPKLTRFLVRRATGEVFIWTERLATNHADLEEVCAESAAEALRKQTIPDPRKMSPGTLEAMQKETLIVFASHRLGIELDAARPLAELREQVKAAI